MNIDWKTVISAGAFALQVIVVVGAIVTGDARTQSSIAEIRTSQLTTSAKVDILYNRFVGAGLDLALGKNHP